MKFGKFFHSLAIATVLCVCGFSVYAQTMRPGCDPEVMDAIEAKSWLHAQRRLTQNKNFILKPDSVLEYSCFNQFLGYFAATPGVRRFSENDPPYPLWGNVSAVHSETIDFALYETVMQPLYDYLDTNFFHTFLAGRMVDVGGQAPDYALYDCHAMQAVWEIARCTHFYEEDQDGFFDFPWYENNDPRAIPQEFQCLPDSERIGFAIAECTTCDPPMFMLTAENDTFGSKPYEEDPIIVAPLLDKMLPGDCGNSALVPTGVKIVIPGDKDISEHVCTVPSCSYDGSACVR